MMEVIVIALLVGFYLYYMFHRDTIESKLQLEEGYKMSNNDAVVIVTLKDIDRSKDIFYVGLMYNPQSTMASQKDFSDFIFHSEVYEDRMRALKRAEEIDNLERTKYGVSFYDGFSSYTFGDAIAKFNRRQYVS